MTKLSSEQQGHAYQFSIFVLPGDWGYLLCHTPDSAAALEAASEDADISVSGHVVKIQSLKTASLLYSSAQKVTATAGNASPLPMPKWRPLAAYAVYPDDYPDRPLDEEDSADDYGPDDKACMSAGEMQRSQGLLINAVGASLACAVWLLASWH